MMDKRLLSCLSSDFNELFTSWTCEAQRQRTFFLFFLEVFHLACLVHISGYF